MFDKLMGIFQAPEYQVEEPAPREIKKPEAPAEEYKPYKEFVTNVPIRGRFDPKEDKERFKTLKDLLIGSYS